MKTLDEILAQHPFFKDLGDENLKLVAGCAQNAVFKAGEFVFREGKQADTFYLLKSGRVALQMEAPSRPPLVIQTFGEGDILGWSWMVAPYRWIYDALALEDTRVFAVDGKCLRTKCEENHDLGYEILKRVAVIMEQRLEATRMQVMDIYGKQT
jgi:CRP-like cAMP-binding protein